MSNRDLTQVESVFHAVLERSRDDREAYLEQACQGDQSLYAEVSSLISAYDSRGRFIQEPALDLGLQVLSQSSEFSLIGKSIGTYKVISRLGKGGMGEVYLAEDTKLARKVALKFISPEFFGDNWARRQLIKEAQAVARLDHPNTCPVYGIEEIDEKIFIVMKYVEGETLAELIRQKKVPPEKVVPLAMQIVGALAEAHSHGIIHRDIKPKNIMVTPGGQIKVLDFGLAKTIQRSKDVVELNDDSISQIAQGAQPGTIAYMSPEQLRGERLDYRSDIFSVGTVLYEMVVGTNPFARPTPVETISAILADTPAPLKNAVPPKQKELGPIIMTCLEKRLDARFQSATDLLIQLDSLNELSGRPSVGWRPSARLVLQIAFALLLVFVGVFIYLQLEKTERVAILPFENVTGDANQNYLAMGFADNISTRLTGLAKLKVRPATTLTGYKNGNANAKQIGIELGVDAVLKGTLSLENQSKVLKVQLFRTADGSVLWDRQYEVDQTQNIFTTELDIARGITRSIEFSSGNDETKVQRAVGASNPEARKEFWLGKYYWRNRGNNKSTLDNAIQHYNAAIQLEPTFAEAYAGLADCYAYWNVVAYGQASTQDAMSKAIGAAKDALDLNRNLPEAHTALATVYLKYYWDWEEAENEFREAIRLNSEYAPAHYGFSLLLSIRSRHAEAISEGRTALDLDPFSPATNLNYCRSLFYARRFEESTTCFDKLVTDFPDYDTGKYVRAWIYFHMGRRDEALATFSQVYAKDKRLGGAALGFTYGQLGRKTEAQTVLNELFAMPKEVNLPPQEIALVYYGMGDIDNALIWFEKSAKDHFGPFATIMVDPIFDKLRQDSRFSKLLKTYDVPFPHARP